MPQTAKIFTNGRSQAVRLPASCRFDCREVFVRKNVKTGEVVLTPKPENWEDFFKLVEQIDVSDDFINDRDKSMPQKRKSL